MKLLSIPFGWRVQAVYEEAAIVATHASAVIDGAAADFMQVIHDNFPGNLFAWPLTIQFCPINPLSIGPTHLFWSIDTVGIVRTSSHGREVLHNSTNYQRLPSIGSVEKESEAYMGTKEPVEPDTYREQIARAFDIYHATSQDSMFKPIEAQPRNNVGTVMCRTLEEAFRATQGVLNKQWTHRSTSVGDIIVDTLDNYAYMVCGMGFKHIPDLDVAKEQKGEVITDQDLEAYEAKLLDEFTADRLPEGGLKL